MRNIAVVDAGPLIALFDKTDRYHQVVKSRLGEFRTAARGRLMTSWPIITEAAYILKDRVCREAQLDFLQWVSDGGVEIFELSRGHLARIIELQARYADLPMDFADGTALVIAEELKITSVFSVDKDFSIYRILGRHHFENLMQR